MRIRVLAVLLAVAVAAVACGGSDAADVAEAVVEPTEAPAPTVAPTEVPPTEVPPTEVPAPEPTEAPEPEPEPTEVALVENPTGSGCDGAHPPGRTTETFLSEDRERVFELVVPESYDASTPMPVVLNWHGLGSNGPDQLGFSEYEGLANSEGFIVVAATGIPAPGDTSNSWEVGNTDPTRDDLLMANTLLDVVIATVCVDESRVYTTGMSNGGYFSSILVCEMSDRIAAAASVAALAHLPGCAPTRPVPFIGFHGVDDEVVPYFGGGESSLLPAGQTAGLFEPAIPDEFVEFVETYGCDTTATESTIGDDVTVFDYANCDVEMTFYRIDNAGHTWPGSTTSLAISQGLGIGVTTTDVNASNVSWEFFSRHSLDG